MSSEPGAGCLAVPWPPWTRRHLALLRLGSPRFPPGNYRTQLYDKQREEYQPATPGLGMFVEVKDPEDKVSRPRRAPHPPPRFALGRQIKQALVLPLIVSGCAKLVKKKKQKKNSWYYGKNLRFHSSQTLGCFSASCFFQFVADLSVTPPSQLLSLSYFSSL